MSFFTVAVEHFANLLSCLVMNIYGR